MSFSGAAVFDSGKHAIIGSAFGVVTAAAVDIVSAALNKMVAPNGSVSPISNWGYFAYGAVAAPALAGAGIYLGFSVMNSIVSVDTDPLTGLFFSFAVYQNCATASQGANTMKMGLQYLTGAIVSNPVATTPGNPPAVKLQPGSKSSGYGNLSPLHSSNSPVAPPQIPHMGAPRTSGLFPGVGDSTLMGLGCVTCK